MHFLKSRRGKIAAGITAAAVLAIVLVLVLVAAPHNDAPPDTKVLVIVNGDEITEEDVAMVQLQMFHWDRRWVEADEVLEQLIAERLLFREAERKGYVPTMIETEVEVESRLMETGMPVEVFAAILEEEGFSYSDFLEHMQVQLAISNYIHATVEIAEVTEEEAREFYEYYSENYRERNPGEEPPPFDELESRIYAVLEETKLWQAMSAYVWELREEAEIVYTQSA